MSNKRNYFNIGFLDVLLIVFVILKLTGLISWSWVWVLSPIWIPVCILVAIAIVGIIGIYGSS